MTEITNVFHIGAKAPFTFFHATDTHLTLCDSRNDARKQTLAADRARYFPQAEMHLRESANMARECGSFLVHTGDLIDFVSEANLDAAAQFMQENDCFFTAGNHEFSLYVGEAFEDEAYRAQSFDRVQAAFPHSIRFSSRHVNGVNFVGLDNSYYRIEPWQLSRLKAEAQRGEPIVLCMHTPLFTEKLFAYSMRSSDNAGLMSVPEELMQDYSDYRYLQQLEDASTHAAYEYILNCPAIRLVLTGHLHFDYETMLTPRLPMLVTGCDTVRRITLR